MHFSGPFETVGRPPPTFFGRLPLARIDHVFVNPDCEVRKVDIPRSELVRLASDHLPLIVELLIHAAQTKSEIGQPPEQI